MSGRGLANAGVFVLGVILLVGGAWGIFRGSQYIQIEQGWSSVISGSVAVTGGVLTLAVGLVLRRLDALLRALLSLGADPGLPTAAAPEAPEAERIQERTPLSNRRAVFVEPDEEARFTAPGLQAATANLETLADDHHSESVPSIHPSHAAAAVSDPSSHFPPETLRATQQGPADDMARGAGVSDEPELDAAIEQLLAEERARGEPLREEPAQVQASDEMHERAAEPEGSPRQAEGRGGGWRGLFSRKDRGLPTSAAPETPQVEPAPRAQSELAGVLPENESSTTTFPLREVDHIDPLPRTGDDWFDRALSGLDEVGSARPSAPAKAEDIPNKIGSRQEIRESRLEISPRQAEAASAGAPSSSDPAVIGRYTSGNTTYVMYADGSIEAETPTGILRFASLADLKVYVEGGQ